MPADERGREDIMEKLKGQVDWEPSFERGLERARELHRPVLLDFFKPG